ncbi:hypothetical protein J1614_005446 [Plenodomus biglobosus]|nr:hypothetical protein J1614_005446 [Plenodomus biglobosus]
MPATLAPDKLATNVTAWLDWGWWALPSCGWSVSEAQTSHKTLPCLGMFIDEHRMCKRGPAAKLPSQGQEMGVGM